MMKAAKLMGAHIVQSVFHKFNPYGLSGVVVIKESHFAIHTWPEYRYAAVDLFSCGKMEYEKGFEYLREIFGSDKLKIAKILRGQ
jgi:S-adenosylmethionine decarboxylase proenzyme